jgi:hypothetical protein
MSVCDYCASKATGGVFEAISWSRVTAAKYALIFLSDFDGTRFVINE